VRLAHREAELSLLATHILLAHAHLALRPATTEAAKAGDPVISPRKVLMAIRAEFKACEQRLRASYGQRLQGCRAEVRQQKSPKACRDWPRRKPHEAPKPPLLHPLTDEQKLLLNQHQPLA
jgi:hypothetical protein